MTFRKEDIPLWILVAKVLDNCCRAWPVSVRWFRIGCCCPESTSPPSCFYDTSIWDILCLFQWKSMGRVARCSKWLLGAWLDRFTMILRCWLVVWVKWACPLSLWHCDPEYVQLKSGFHGVGRPIHGPSYTIESKWGNFGTLRPPGVQVLPHCVVCSYRARQPLQMWQISHF